MTQRPRGPRRPPPARSTALRALLVTLPTRVSAPSMPSSKSPNKSKCVPSSSSMFEDTPPARPAASNASGTPSAAGGAAGSHLSGARRRARRPTWRPAPGRRAARGTPHPRQRAGRGSASAPCPLTRLPPCRIRARASLPARTDCAPAATPARGAHAPSLRPVQDRPPAPRQMTWRSPARVAGCAGNVDCWLRLHH